MGRSQQATQAACGAGCAAETPAGEAGRLLTRMYRHPLPAPPLQAGAVALPDLTDEVCRDQQEQLAALAALQLTTSSMHVPRPQPAAAGRAAWSAADLASRPHSVQQVVCSNLLAPPEEHQECFPFAAGGACDLESWSGGAPTSALAALGW